MNIFKKLKELWRCRQIKKQCRITRKNMNTLSYEERQGLLKSALKTMFPNGYSMCPNCGCYIETGKCILCN